MNKIVEEPKLLGHKEVDGQQVPVYSCKTETVITNKKFATTLKGARQLITHKKVLVNGEIVNSPSYIVPVELENKIVLKPNKKKTVKEKVIETVKEAKEEPTENKEEAKPEEEKNE